MQLSEFQQKSARTANYSLTRNERVVQAVFGLFGETGEVIDAIKKYLYHAHELDYNRVYEELGDALFYFAELCNALDISLESVAARNIAKLKARYPDGFTTERSIKREA